MAEEEINKIKFRGNLSDSDRAQIRGFREKQDKWTQEILSR